MLKYSLEVKVYGTFKNPAYASILNSIMHLRKETFTFTVYDIEPDVIMTKEWRKKKVE